MSGFTDTSALLKLYVSEPGSRWMYDVIRTGGIAISEIAITEVRVSLNRRARDRSITDVEAVNAWRRFRHDLRSFIVATITRQTLLQAGLLAARSPVVLRTLDAIQLHGASQIIADARRLEQDIPLFVSADTRLLTAAAALGFVTANPLDHV